MHPNFACAFAGSALSFPNPIPSTSRLKLHRLNLLRCLRFDVFVQAVPMRIDRHDQRTKRLHAEFPQNTPGIKSSHHTCSISSICIVSSAAAPPTMAR